LAIAAECLVNRREQEEVLQILDKIRKETGWRVGFLHTELKEKWGWNAEEAFQQQQQQQQQQQAPAPPMDPTSSGVIHQSSNLQDFAYPPASMPPAPPAPPPVKQMPRSGIVNPILRTADFSAPTHPYQSHYVPLNQHLQHNHNQYNHY
jgi:hypothetical protein